MPDLPKKVAWISFFPVEWLEGAPEVIRKLPKLHPASWQRVLLRELKTEKNLKLHVFAVRKQFPRDLSFELDGVTFHCLKVPAGMRAASLFWWETWRLRQRLAQVNPDLVHAWGTERAAALVASRLKYPYLVTMQGLLQWYSQHVDLGRGARIDVLLEKPALRRASVITTESSFSTNWLREHYPHLEIHQAEHAPAWLFHQVERRPETRPLRFLFVGALSPIKGTDLLFQALDRLTSQHDFRLSVVGSGSADYVDGLRRETSRELWSRTTFRQNLTPEQIATEMSTATLMLFPTRVDTSPNSVKEAVVAGLPVVASAVGGIVDYVRSDLNGLTFAAGNLEEFVRAIRSAIAHPLFCQGRVDETTLGRMREYLSPRVMKQKFLKAYERAWRPD